MKAVDKNNSGAIDYSGRNKFLSFIFQNLYWLQSIEKDLSKKKDQKWLSKCLIELKYLKFYMQDGSGTITTEEIKTIFGGNALISDSVW